MGFTSFKINDMNKYNHAKYGEMLITKESLRPPLTRSKTPSATKETAEQQDLLTPTEQNSIETKKPRCRRQWTEWSGEEKRCFYEGLAEYGKDYGKIQSFMNKKLKLKNNSDCKTKEQIRSFYHRTWSKISKSLNIPHEDDSKKNCRKEIHYLLCLGELRRKKSLGFGAKVMKQLDDLVRKGFTYVRCNGRNLRIRPPNRSLKRLYQDETPEIILPKSVTVEFLPNSNISFNFVQQHAFNPRLRFTGVNINAKFSEVFDMVHKRFTDLRDSRKLDLHIYPLKTEVDNSKVGEIICNAEDMLQNFEKTQDTDIILEENTKNVESVSKTCEGEHKEINNVDNTDEKVENIFPKIFERLSDYKENKLTEKTVQNFPGYWTYMTSKNVLMRTLFVAFDQKPILKFKYEWKLIADEKSTTFATDSMRNLVELCEQKTQAWKENEFQKLCNTGNSLGIISPNQKNGILTAIPLRPRPGRKRSFQRQDAPQSPQSPIVPSMKPVNSFLKNAVAVNLIPHAPQILQFSKPKLTNSISTTNLSDGQINSMEVSPTKEEVLEEGFQEHFQSLKNIIATSSLINSQSEEKKIQLQKTPLKIQSTSRLVPPSPNLEWLNGESVDISLTSFLNVCDIQQLQQREVLVELNTSRKEATTTTATTTTATDNISLLAVLEGSLRYNNNLKANGHSDPILPAFHSGETSQGPLDLNFELSNHDASNSKSRDQFTLS